MECTPFRCLEVSFEISSLIHFEAFSSTSEYCCMLWQISLICFLFWKFFTYFITVYLYLIIKLVFLLLINFYSTCFSSKISIRAQASIRAKVDLSAILWYFCWSDFNLLCSSTMLIDRLTSCDGKIFFN